MEFVNCLKTSLKSAVPVAKVLERLPPDPNWKFQKQSTPPSFGWATRVGMARLEREVAQRLPHCKQILAQAERYCSFVPGKVSFVVLSCKRWHTLEKLLSSLQNWSETYPKIEKILIDNGSGPELVAKARATQIFDTIVDHPQNLGMIGALRDAYRRVDGEYVLYVEDDFILDDAKPFLHKCITLLNENPEIGIIRLKNQNNWWKPQRVIAPKRKTSDGTEFWTWLPSSDGMMNGWCAGSVMFRRAAYFSVGELPDVPQVTRKKRTNHAFMYEYIYGKEFNKRWLAAKIDGICPFVQPNDNLQSPGWS